MSTATTSNFWDMTSDAGFRVCASAISGLLQTVNAGLLGVTADTGQINLVTVTKPGAANTSAGYQIYKFTDSIGSLYLKVEYGTGALATIFSTWVTIGTGSDGAGNITGVLVARVQSQAGSAATSLVTNYPSYACCVNGALWIVAAVGSSANSTGSRQTFFGLFRTCDSSGNLTGDGFESIVSSSTLSTSAVNLSSLSVVTSTAGLHCLVPYGITNSNYGTGGNNDYQVWRHEIPLPQTFATNYAGSYVASEAGAATTVTMALIGSTTHTMFFTGTSVLQGANQSNSYGFLLVYE